MKVGDKALKLSMWHGIKEREIIENNLTFDSKTVTLLCAIWLCLISCRETIKAEVQKPYGLLIISLFDTFVNLLNDRQQTFFNGFHKIWNLFSMM